MVTPEELHAMLDAIVSSGDEERHRLVAWVIETAFEHVTLTTLPPNEG